MSKSVRPTIVQVLMDRDGLTKLEATKQVRQVMELVNNVLETGGGYDDVEEIMISELGLEMDYIFDIL